MKKKAKGLLYEHKFLTRRLALMAVKYEFALQDGRRVDAERILKKATRYEKRVKEIEEMLGIKDKKEKK